MKDNVIKPLSCMYFKIKSKRSFNHGWGYCEYFKENIRISQCEHCEHYAIAKGIRQLILLEGKVIKNE